MGDKHNDESQGWVCSRNHGITTSLREVQEALEALGQLGTTGSSQGQAHESYVYHILSQAIRIASDYAYEESDASDAEESDSEMDSTPDETSNDYFDETTGIDTSSHDQDRVADGSQNLDQRDTESWTKARDYQGKE